MPREPLSEFERFFQTPASHVARAPGRVNLIGEHIDYCGLSVLPMALERSVRLAFRPRTEPRIRIATTTPGLAAREFRLDEPVESGPAGDWANYARAAAQALMEQKGFVPSGDGWVGFDALVTADLPLAAGLSSSSALVVATALALLCANGDADRWGRAAERTTERLALAEQLARGERYVGTAGGGMDQAACLAGRRGCALAIHFGPLRATPIPMPPDWAVVVAHSGERAEKSAGARATYNERTRQADRGLAAVRAALGHGSDVGVGYRDLIDTCGHADLLAAGRDSLDPTLSRRFRHIVSESDRVERFELALGASDLDAAGALLVASHASLRDDYEVSTRRLDELVETAMSAGAAGARLTGAGLGGCILALCHADAGSSVASALAAGATGDVPPPFAASAGDGAEVRPL